MQLEANARPIVKQEVDFYRAGAAAWLALQGGGDASAAVRQLLELVRQDRDNLHYYEAVRLLGDLAVTLGSYDNATRYYQELAKSALAGGQTAGDRTGRTGPARTGQVPGGDREIRSSPGDQLDGNCRVATADDGSAGQGDLSG